VVRGETVEVMEFGSGRLAQDAAAALAAVTARAAGAPTVMIHVVDGDHLRLAGGAGLPPDWDTSGRVPITSTLAGAVFAGQSPLIVADIGTDDRVPARAPARAAGFRSYAGYPIRDRDGLVVGVCAAMDTAIRRWQPEQLAGVAESARACGAFVEQRLAAESADRSRRFLDALLNSLQVGVAAVNASGRLVVTNSVMRELSDDFPEDGGLQAWAERRPLAEAAGLPLPPDAVPLLRALQGERLHDVAVNVERPGRRQRTLLTDAQPILGHDGGILGAVVAAHDVTDRWRVERFHDCEMAVSRVLAEAHGMYDAAPEVLRMVTETLGWQHAQLWLVDDEAQLLRRAAVHHTGGNAALRVPEQLPCGEGLAGRAWQDGHPIWVRDVTTDATLMADDADDHGLRTALALPVPSGESTLAVLVLYADVVEDPQELLVTLLQGVAAQIGQFLERHRAQELQLALALTKDEYLALIGHEMRTPLTSIAAYTDLLLELDGADFDGEGRDLVKVVQRNSDQLRRIVDELLDLSALDSGHATITCRPCDLASVVGDAVTRIAADADAGGLTVGSELPQRCVVSADEARLRQVVEALLSNAVLHTMPGGRIDVTLVQVAGAAELTVSDTGVGIPAEDQPKVFTRFYRSSRTREQRIPGAGLGLAISRAIIERHHGSIRLLPRHHPGVGVRIRLPLSCG
jgi:signal transduction histidine kinase/PAS domain-containing protein